jgi:hypothetical protein
LPLAGVAATEHARSAQERRAEEARSFVDPTGLRPGAVVASAGRGAGAVEGEGSNGWEGQEVNGGKNVHVRALFDYEGTTETELDLRADDIVSPSSV